MSSITDLVPTQVGHYGVPFLNDPGSGVFAGEDNTLTEEVLESDCLSDVLPAVLLAQFIPPLWNMGETLDCTSQVCCEGSVGQYLKSAYHKAWNTLNSQLSFYHFHVV